MVPWAVGAPALRPAEILIALLLSVTIHNFAFLPRRSFDPQAALLGLDPTIHLIPKQIQTAFIPQNLVARLGFFLYRPLLAHPKVDRLGRETTFRQPSARNCFPTTDRHFSIEGFLHPSFEKERDDHRHRTVGLEA